MNKQKYTHTQIHAAENFMYNFVQCFSFILKLLVISSLINSFGFLLLAHRRSKSKSIQWAKWIQYESKINQSRHNELLMMCEYNSYEYKH